jgi:hypothetical protein
VPRLLTENQQIDLLLHDTDQFIKQSRRAQNTWQRNHINALPQTKKRRKKGGKIKLLQEARNSEEANHNRRLQEIRHTVIQNINKG